jgi:hypothetical protein
MMDLVSFRTLKFFHPCPFDTTHHLPYLQKWQLQVMAVSVRLTLDHPAIFFMKKRLKISPSIRNTSSKAVFHDSVEIKMIELFLRPVSFCYNLEKKYQDSEDKLSVTPQDKKSMVMEPLIEIWKNQKKRP